MVYVDDTLMLFMNICNGVMSCWCVMWCVMFDCVLCDALQGNTL